MTEQLTRIVAQPDLPTRALATGQRLLHRLVSPVKIALFDPAAASGQLVKDLLESGPSLGEIVLITGEIQAADFDHIDMAIWITARFDPPEQSLWASAPENLMDHAYLVAVNPSPAMNGHLREMGRMWFLKYVPLLLTQPDCCVALRDDISMRIRRGQQAGQDSAALFVEKHRHWLSGALPVTAVAKQPQAPQHPVADQHGLWSDGVAYLTAQAQSLAQIDLAASDRAYTKVLSLCAETAEGLADLMADAPPEMSAFQQEVLMAADALVLMSVEDDEASAIDAVTTLLQLQKELQTDLAAKALTNLQPKPCDE